ncbi:NUDIX domain-containing protein [Brucella pseudogrignonensis]
MDQPIAYTKEGRPLFDNTPTVVCVIVPDSCHRFYLAVKRANDPGKGLWALPGGYHMRGESWQEAGAREVLEETGYVIDTKKIKLLSLDTDEYGNNLIVALSHYPESPNRLPTDGEASDVLWISQVGSPDEWAFPRHLAALESHMEKRRKDALWMRPRQKRYA